MIIIYSYKLFLICFIHTQKLANPIIIIYSVFIDIVLIAYSAKNYYCCVCRSMVALFIVEMLNDINDTNLFFSLNASTLIFDDKSLGNNFFLFSCFYFWLFNILIFIFWWYQSNTLAIEILTQLIITKIFLCL